MRLKCLAQGQYCHYQQNSRFEPGTSWLRVRGLIHWATTAPHTIHTALCFFLSSSDADGLTPLHCAADNAGWGPHNSFSDPRLTSTSNPLTIRYIRIMRTIDSGQIMILFCFIKWSYKSYTLRKKVRLRTLFVPYLEPSGKKVPKRVLYMFKNLKRFRIRVILR